jgi:hypothetical protein
MFAQNLFPSAIAGQLRDCRPGKNPTSGGSSETETNEPMVMPNGSPTELRPVTTTTPVGK